MQFLIDTNEESPAGLRIVAQVLTLLAGAADGEEGEEIEAAGRPAVRPLKTPPPPPISKPVAVPAAPVPLPPGNVPPAPVVHPAVRPLKTPTPADVPTGTEVDPAVAFARGGNVVPLVPAPPAPIVTEAATSTMTPTLAPAATVALPPAPAAVPASAAGERDSAGLPWDERIHSETRKTNADGTWRYRRNLDAGVKAAVTAELKLQYGQQVIPSQSVAAIANALQLPASAPSVPPPPADNIRYDGMTPTVMPPPPVSTAVSVPPAPSLGVPGPDNAPVVPSGPVTSFRDLMTKVNQALAAGRLTQPQLAEACKASGLDSVSALAAQPMLVPDINTYLNRWLG